MPQGRGRPADIFRPSAPCKRRAIREISLRSEECMNQGQPRPCPAERSGKGNDEVLSSAYELIAKPLSHGHDKGQQGNRPRPLDGHGQFPLMFRTVSGNPARHDLASLRCEITERLRFLVFNFQIRVGTETAEFPPVKEFFLRSCARSARASGCRCKSHDQ
jgi:hypothetical protein